MKTCARCNEEKDRVRFYKEARKKDGLCSICIECEKKRCADRKEKDVEHYRKIKRENARKHAEKTNEKNRRKFTENRDEYLKKSREKYAENREAIRKRQNELRSTPERKLKDAERQRIWQAKNKDKVRIAALKYSKTHREKVLKWHSEWKKINREQARANRMIIDHVRRGTLRRPDTCSKCLKECKPHGHHEDYSKPLEVIWLCQICHNHAHGKLLDQKP